MEKSIYRILDANFNRAREGLRVMEEYCRFVLNHSALSARLKAVRHRLSQTIGIVDADRLLCCRDSQGDVGKELRVEGHLKRGSLDDCVHAGTKRLTEALRVMAEVGQTLDIRLYDEFERLRFDVYTLEKDISIAAHGASRFRGVRLYVLITVKSQAECDKMPDLVKACAAGGADCIQLRCKGLPDQQMFAAGEIFVKRCKDAHIVGIINDRPDIGLLSGADGVHLGQTDLSVRHVRSLQTRPYLIGLSTHNPAQLHSALSEPIDYVALGPVYATATKSYEPVVGLDYLRQASEILRGNPIPRVAIGGITLDNIRPVLDLGIRTVAVCSAVCQAANPEKACASFKSILSSAV
jgi:thiamine-phosphate pyrophosphorylase